MSLFGKVLAVLNLLAAGGFLYLAATDYKARQDWSYSVFRYDLAINGLPVDQSQTDEQGRPAYLNIGEKLGQELTGSSEALTQEDALERLRTEMISRAENPAVKSTLVDPKSPFAGSKVAKWVEVLLPLATSVKEREAVRNRLSNLSDASTAPLEKKFNETFDEAKSFPERERKREAIARIFVALVDVLAPPPAQGGGGQPDAVESTDYRRARGVVGVEHLSAALDAQARRLEEMASHVDDGRNRERTRFAREHAALLASLLELHHELRSLKTIRDTKEVQAQKAKDLAAKQKELVAALKKQMGEEQTLTAAELDRLAAEQEELFKIRVLLRDAKRVNLELEAKVTELERKQR
jgi:hypothetical protein